MFKEKVAAQSVRLALSMLAGSSLLAGYAHAQTQEENKAPVQKVEITGSNIKRVDKEGPSPIQTISAKDIRESGAATVADLLRKVPALGSGGAVDGLDGGFSRGVSTASLRGLGSSSTLILLNGRRMTPAAYANPNSGQSTLYDLNTIPISAIERIEILKDGASAVYGSDAIAGVINFITKQDYQGGEISGTVSANQDGEFGRQRANAFMGFGSLNEDGYNAFIAADFSKRNATVLSDARAWEKAQYLNINAFDGPYFSYISNQPFFYREKAPGSNAFYTSGKANDPNIINRTNCDSSRLLVGGAQYNMLPSSYLYGRTFCNYNGNPGYEAQGAGQDMSLMSRGTLKIGGDTKVFGEFAYTNSDRKYAGVSRTIDGRTPTTVFPQIGAGTSFQAILPVGHPDNPFPNSRAAVAYRFENLPGSSENVSNNYRALVGINGNNFNWDWESAILWNRADRSEKLNGFLMLDTVQKLISQNMSLAQVATAPGITRQLQNKDSAEILQIDAKGSTEFGHLAGGAFGLATGIELRKEKMRMTPDSAIASGNVVGLVNQFMNGERNVSSAFVELRAPFLTNLEMEVAGRYDKYPNLKGNFVPKIGVKWTPVETLALRGTYAEGFRAPALNQVTPGGTQYFLNNVTDPIRCPDAINPKPGADILDCKKSISGLAGSSPDLKPETSKSLTLGFIFSPTKSFDIAVDAYKIRKEGEVALLGSDTVINHPNLYPGKVIRDPNQATWLRDANGNLIPNSGPLFSVLTPYINQGSTETSGIDLDAKLRNNLGVYGSLETRLNVTYIMSFRSAANPGDPEINVVGTRGGISNWSLSTGDIPRVKAALASTWTYGPHAVNGAVNFIDSISLQRRNDGATIYPIAYCHYGSGQPASATGLGGLPKYSSYYPDCKIPSWTTIDAGYTYTGIKNLTMSLNVQNLFDSKAPYDPAATSSSAGYGYDSTLHNPMGRYFSLTANYKFK